MFPLRTVITLKLVHSKINFVRGRLRKLQRTLFSDKYLLYTNLSISILLSSAGDAVEQRYEIYSNRIEKWNARRTRNMGITGATVGVAVHYWYLFLDKHLPGRSFKMVVAKVLLDQCLCSPFYISIFFVTLAILEQQSVRELAKDIKVKGLKLYSAEWIVWPTAQMINFHWLPTKYRVLYDNLISFMFDIYTSKVTYKTDTVCDNKPDESDS